MCSQRNNGGARCCKNRRQRVGCIRVHTHMRGRVIIWVRGRYMVPCCCVTVLLLLLLLAGRIWKRLDFSFFFVSSSMQQKRRAEEDKSRKESELIATRANGDFFTTSCCCNHINHPNAQTATHTRGVGLISSKAIPKRATITHIMKPFPSDAAMIHGPN